MEGTIIAASMKNAAMLNPRVNATTAAIVGMAASRTKTGDHRWRSASAVDRSRGAVMHRSVQCWAKTHA
jgi:hypothetical protein